MASGADSFGSLKSATVASHANTNPKLDQTIKQNKPDNFFGTVIDSGVVGGSSVQRPVTGAGSNSGNLSDQNGQHQDQDPSEIIRNRVYLQQNGTQAKVAPPSPKMKDKQNKGDSISSEVIFTARGHNGDTRGIFNSFGAGTLG
mgnify:CR=1 FL=1